MSFLNNIFGGNKSGNKSVDAMIAICVHDPDVYLQPPTNVKDIAIQTLERLFKGYTLSSNAKVAYLISQGRLSFVESEKKASKDLPEQMKNFMTNNGLEPNKYNFRFSSENLRANIKVLWTIAVKK